MPKRDADDLMRNLTDLNGDGQQDDMERQVGAALLDAYAQGRLETAKLDLTAAYCTDLIRKQADRLEAARVKSMAPR